MAARIADRLPEGDEWQYQVKFDGYRALLIKRGPNVQIRSRNDKDLTAVYPTVTAAARHLHAESAMIDGEIVAVDGDGRPSFQALQHRGAHARTRHCVLCVRSARARRSGPAGSATRAIDGRSFRSCSPTPVSFTRSTFRGRRRR